MHFLLRITNRLNVMRKSDKNASRNDLKITRNNKLSLNRVKKELKKDDKIVSKSKINKIKKIM